MRLRIRGGWGERRRTVLLAGGMECRGICPAFGSEAV